MPLFSFGPWFWGTFAAALLPLLALSGLGLLFVFDPSAPRLSAADLRQTSPWGFLRELHIWASHALVIAAWLHILRVYMVGSYRRLLGWSMSIALLIVILALATTGTWLGAGSVLPWPTLYALHCLLLPLLLVALVTFWWRRRGAGS